MRFALHERLQNFLLPISPFSSVISPSSLSSSLLVCTLRPQVWFWESGTLWRTGPLPPDPQTLVWCQKSMSLFCCMTKQPLPKGTVITSLSSFQLTPGKGIIGNHPCNAVPLSLWQLSETTALRFCRFDVKSELYTPSVPQTQHVVSYVGFHSPGFGLLRLRMKENIKKFSILSAEVALWYIELKKVHFFCWHNNHFVIHLGSSTPFHLLTLECPFVFVLPINKHCLS